ncbi:XdhC family protein [Paenibacillus sp. strain BS8-2]
MEAEDIVRRAAALEGKAVLATIVSVEGHAYRKAGASMLLEADGSLSGSVSPGCLESDLKHYVDSVLGHGGCQWAEYDMRSVDDFSWGEAIGCGGYIRILLEPISGALAVAISEISRLHEQGRDALLIRQFGEASLPQSYAVKAAYSYHKNELFDGERQPSYQRFAIKPRVVLFGGGDDAIPVAKLIQLAGFQLTVADFRESVLTPIRFPGAKLRLGFPHELASELRLTGQEYVIIMSHQYQRDYEFLQLALQSCSRYIGVMGSASRTRRMFPDGDIPEAVHYPVGMAIGADGPEEIAVSIAAELIGVRRRGDDNFEHTNRGTISGSRLKQTYGKTEAAYERRRL